MIEQNSLKVRWRKEVMFHTFLFNHEWHNDKIQTSLQIALIAKWNNKFNLQNDVSTKTFKSEKFTVNSIIIIKSLHETVSSYFEKIKKSKEMKKRT